MSEQRIRERLLEAIELAEVAPADRELASAMRAYQRVDELFDLVRRPARLAVLDDLRPSPNIPGYDDIEFLAQGGLGTVYKARDSKLDRWVALKLLTSAHPDPHQLGRFQVEAEAAAKLDHPHIVPIYSIGKHDGLPYFSMAFVEGRDLAKVVAQGPLAPRHAAQVLTKVVEAVDYAHEQGIVHRDLKPANVMIDQFGQPRVMDFGLAKRIETEQRFTLTGQILGTPSYMAPEQAEDGDVGPWTDVFSLGAMLYHLLTGRPPFQSANVIDTLRQVREDEVLTPRRLNPNLPKDLETICLKCLEKQPQHRYSTAELRAELSRYLNGEPIQARQLPTVVRWLRWSRRNPAKILFTAATIVGLIATAAGMLYFREAELREVAEVAQDVAEQERDRAEQQQGRAEEAEGLARQALYAARIYASPALLREAGIELVSRILESPPDAGYAGSFEYRYLLRQCRPADRVLAKQETPLDAIASSSDGQFLAIGGDDGSIVIFLSANGEQVRRLHGHSAAVRSLSFSPDGIQLASCGSDSVTRIWNWRANGAPKELEHPAPLRAVAFAPDGARIATAGGDRFIRIWNVQTAEEALVLEGHRAEATSVAFGPKGRLLVSGSIDQIPRVWDTETGESVHELHGHYGPVWTVTFSPDGQRVAGSGHLGSVMLWDASTGVSMAQRQVHAGNTLDLAFELNGKHLLSAGSDGRLAWLRTPDLETVEEIMASGKAIRELAVLPDGRPATVGSDGTAQIIRRPSTVVRAGRWCFATAFSPEGSQLVTTTLDRQVRLWDVRTAQLRKELKGHTSAVEKATFVTSDLMVSAGNNQDGGQMILWSLDQSKAVETVTLTSRVSSLAADRNRRWVVVGCEDGSHHVFKAENDGLDEVDQFAHGRSAVRCIAVAPDGEFLVTGNGDGTVRCWDLSSREQLWSRKAHDGLPNAAAYSPDGRLFVTGGTKGMVNVWRASESEPLWTFPAGSFIYSIALTHDSKRLLTGGSDRRVKVWDIGTGLRSNELEMSGDGLSLTTPFLPTLSLGGHTGPVWSVSASPTEHTIVSGSEDGTIRFWRGASGTD